MGFLVFVKVFYVIILSNWILVRDIFVCRPWLTIKGIYAVRWDSYKHIYYVTYRIMEQQFIHWDYIIHIRCIGLLFICRRIKEHSVVLRRNPKRFIDPDENKKDKGEVIFLHSITIIFCEKIVCVWVNSLYDMRSK